MNKYYQSFLALSFLLMLFIYSKGQEKKLLITTTYYNKDEYKVVSFIDDRMNLVKEEYFYVPTNSKVAIVEYDSSQKIQKFVAIDKKKTILVIDYKAGKYSDYETGVYLNFTGNLKFEGIQKSRQVICNYKNGQRHGSYIQIDSAVSGQKLVSVKRPNIYLLQKNIIAYYDNIEKENVYKKFEAIHLNFNNNLLNGTQRGVYSSGLPKFITEYKNGRLLKHISYEKDKSVNTKITTIDGVSDGRYIKNGQIINDGTQKSFYIPELASAGEILHVKFRDKRTTNYDADEEELPEREDLEEIEIHYAGSEEKEMIEKIMKDKKIFRYYISTIRTLSQGDYKIITDKIHKP